MESKSFITKPSEGYSLFDSGNGEKLEKIGGFVLRRPDPQALWNKSNPAIWDKADAVFETSKNGGKWIENKVDEKWNTNIEGIVFETSLSEFKHIGIFPEQSPNWLWIKEKIKDSERVIKVLNLFGYTGGATIASLLSGAEVVHVDSSKVAITRAKNNAELSGVGDKSVRWILDDAKAFVEREIRRGSKYDAIIMDPPAFGHGIKKELWKIEEDLLPFIDRTKKLLSKDPLFFILNGYASGYSAFAYKQILDWLAEDNGGAIEFGELLIEEEGGKRFLPAGISARWSK